MSRRSTLRVSVAAAGMALAATAGALDPREFVAGWPIEAPAGAEVFDVPLTAEVYAAAASIEQLAVLDANGEAQSFFRRSGAVPGERRVVLEASPLYAVPFQNGLIVGVTRNESSTSVNVAHRRAGAAYRHGFRARRSRPRWCAHRARARLARTAAAVPARRRRRAEHGSHELAQRRAGVRRGAVGRRRRGAPRARARARERRRLFPRHAARRRRGLALAASDVRDRDGGSSDDGERARAAARCERGCPRAPSPARSTSMPAGRCRSRPSRSRSADGDGWLRARRCRERLARRTVDVGRVRRAVLRAGVRGPRIRERSR